MIRKFQVSVRIQVLIIALSLAVTSCILGLSAYLTDEETYKQFFHTAAGSELGFHLTGTEYDNLGILAGQTVDLNVTASSENGIPLYLFIKLDIPSDFELVDFHSLGWHPIEADSNIYYCGNDVNIIALGAENGTSISVLKGIRLANEIAGAKDYEIIITGYAIQAEGIPEGSTPAQIYHMIGGT